MRYATFGYAQIESILATVLRTYLRSARMKGSLVANARKMPRLWLMQGGGAHDKSAPTAASSSVWDIPMNLLKSIIGGNSHQPRLPNNGTPSLRSRAG